MKKSKHFIISCFLSIATITCSLALAFSGANYLRNDATDNNISSASLTFDKDHTSVVTSHGNTVSLIATGVGQLGGSYLFSIYHTNSTGYLNLHTSTPIQKIEKVTFTYSIYECYEFYFYAGPSYGSTASSTSLEGLSFDYINKTVTMTQPFAGNDYHYFMIKYGGMDSLSYCRITSLTITYSCSY